MAQKGYDTNLASEFYVMSVLHRLGCDATITLGNKKAVGILVARGVGEAVTIDVKAVAGKTDWLAGSGADSAKQNHFVVMVSYEGRFKEPAELPRCWIVPHTAYLDLVKTASTGNLKYISRKAVVSELTGYENAWELIVGDKSADLAQDQ